MSPDEYLEGHGQNWYSRTTHPNSRWDAVAQEFLSEVSSRLSITVPMIDWFVPVGWEEVKSHLITRCSKFHDASTARFCDFFYWLGEDYLKGGFSHWNQQSRIMIRSDLDLVRTLRAIAHECRHLYQDHAHGGDWRINNEVQAEEDAYAFEKSLSPRIEVVARLLNQTGS